MNTNKNFYREQTAKEHYNRVYLGKNGGMTKKEAIGEIVGSIALFAIGCLLIWVCAAA